MFLLRLNKEYETHLKIVMLQYQKQITMMQVLRGAWGEVEEPDQRFFIPKFLRLNY